MLPIYYLVYAVIFVHKKFVGLYRIFFFFTNSINIQKWNYHLYILKALFLLQNILFCDTNKPIVLFCYNIIVCEYYNM